MFTAALKAALFCLLHILSAAELGTEAGEQHLRSPGHRVDVEQMNLAVSVNSRRTIVISPDTHHLLFNTRMSSAARRAWPNAGSK